MHHDHTLSRPAGQLTPAAEPLQLLLSTALARDLIGQGHGEDEARKLDTHLAACDMLGLPVPDTAVDDVTRLLSGGHAADKALGAIAPLFEPGDVVELRAIVPDTRATVARCERLDTAEGRAALAAFIRQHIGRRNLYFGVNPRRAELAGTGTAADAGDVTARRIVVLDLDNKDAGPTAPDPGWTATLAALRELGPCYVLDSGNGWHAGLPVDVVEGADLAASVGPLRAALARVGSDAVGDLPRVMRLPFTVNLPNASKRRAGRVPRLALPDGPTLEGTRRPLPDLCAALEGTAVRLGLPGKGAGANGAVLEGAASRTTATGERKTGQPAPSLELLALLLEHLPNEPGGPYDDRDNWQGIVGHAVVGAALAGGFPGEARELFLTWCAKNGGDPAKAGDFYDTCRDPHTGWGTLMRELETHNPAGHRLVKAAEATAVFAREAAENRAALSGFRLAPVATVRAAPIPPRQWLYGRAVIRAFYSLLVAPGGTGKSALLMAEAVAMATGRELLAGDKPHHALTAWYHTAEDTVDDLERTLDAALDLFGLRRADLGDRLILTSGRDWPLRLAREGRDGAEPVPGTRELIVEHARAAGVDVMIFDPIAAMHGVAENDNTAMNVVVGELRRIAEEANAGLVVAHHTSKVAAANMGAAGAGASRGASALVDGARIVRQLDRMKDGDAVKLGVRPEDAWRHLRVDNGKANLAPAGKATWVRLTPIDLGNRTPDYPDGDSVGAVERWAPPAPPAGTVSELALVQAAVDAAHARGEPPAASDRSHHWIGHLAAPILGLDIGGPGQTQRQRTDAQEAARGRLATVLDAWFRDRALVLDFGIDPHDRKRRELVRVGTPAVLARTMHDASDGAEPDTAEGATLNQAA